VRGQHPPPLLIDMSTVLAPSPTLRPRAAPIAAARASRHLDSGVIAAILFAGYAAVSLRRHHLLLTSGYDLGIFEQSVRSWANGQWPTSRLKGVAYRAYIRSRRLRLISPRRGDDEPPCARG